MTFNEFASILKIARMDKHLFPVELIKEFNWIAPPASLEEIAQVEHSLGVRLPEDYTLFLEAYGGGTFGYVEVYTVNTATRPYILDEQPIPTPEMTFLAISSNGCGDYYGFPVVNRLCQPEIVFWDHESGGIIRPTEFNDVFEFIVKRGLYPNQ